MDSCDAFERLCKALKADLFDKLVSIIIDHGISKADADSIAKRYFNMTENESNREIHEYL